MGEIIFQADNLDISLLSAANAQLCLICDSWSFAYCISLESSPHQYKVLVESFDTPSLPFDDPLAYLARVMHSNEELFADFQSVSCSVPGIPFKLARKAEVTERGADALYATIDTAAEREAVLTDDLFDDMVLLYALPVPFIEEVRMYFAGATVCHSLTSLIRTASRDESYKHCVLGRVQIGAIEILYWKNGSLEYVNYFRCKGFGDILYFVSSIYKTLEIDLEGVPLILDGIALDADIRKFLNEHLPSLRIHVRHEEDMESRIARSMKEMACV